MIRITIVGSYVTGITIGVPRMPVFGEALIGDVFILGPVGAAMVIASIPTVIVYLFFSEQVENALTAGAILK